MRIAHVTDVYLPRLGGVELQVRDLADRQRRHGHETLVLTTTPAPSDFVSVPSAAPVLRLGSVGVGPYRGVSDDEILDALDGVGADAVHVHLSAFSPLAWNTARLAGRSGRPTVVSVHSMWNDIAPLVRTYARWRDAASWPVRWAAVSSVAAAAVRDALDGTPVAVLPNGIDPSDWLGPDQAAADGAPTIVSVGRMVRRKRPRALLHALLELRRSHRFRAVLVGDGPLLPSLRREAAGTDITFTGALDRTAIRTLLAGADLYVAPAARESFGIAALEARSAGVPVLARAGSGVADFVSPGREGWLAGSDRELTSLLGALLDAPEQLAEVRVHNRAVPPSIHWDAVLNAADSLYGVGVLR